MPTIGERNAARAQCNIDRNAVIQQDNRRNTALQIEDRIRELETQNIVLESRVEVMGNVIAKQALAQQQEVQLQLAVSQNPNTVMMDGAGAIHNHNTALASEGFRWNETHRSVHNRATKASIMAYIEGLGQYAIQGDRLSKKIYSFFDNQRTKSQQSAERAEKRKTSNRHNTRRHTIVD
ncbi:hypothetical protein INT45_004861 [Circinella minor]|uniref:Uncharacterized protein n=1 Tax=Circinella minor TaxID=1195481 RepID=A0A8H7RHS2_9FUNG|nr:hypothetical protein INT45_004861 [Circinella minor]